MKLWLVILAGGLLSGVQAQSSWEGFSRDSTRSDLDSLWQSFYYWEAEKPAQPLVVVLHTWSGDYTQTQNSLAWEARDRGWNYLHPDFRGSNNTTDACGSERVVSDIDQAIDWALQNLPVNPDSVFVVGASGGGYATLVAYQRSRHRIRGFHAYVPISDLSAWYYESLVRNVKYAQDVLDCTGSSDSTLNETEARRRSPLYWNTPVDQRVQSSLHLYAGVHDGYTGSVPITHSINFYNKVLRDAGTDEPEAYVDQETIITLLTRQRGIGSNGYIGDRKVHLQKNWNNVSLTIFEGGHEMLSSVALELL